MGDSGSYFLGFNLAAITLLINTNQTPYIGSQINVTRIHISILIFEMLLNNKFISKLSIKLY